MAFDEGLAERIRSVLEDERGITEKKMFGGIAFLLDVHLFVGIAKNQFMVRVGPDHYKELKPFRVDDEAVITIASCPRTAVSTDALS